MINWLSPCDPSKNHAAARERYVEGTGLWLIESNGFACWKAGTKRSMWLHGIPGAGKTILCSTIIEDILNSQSDIECVYFYFDFNDSQKQTVDGFLRSILIQLCACRHDFGQIQSLFNKCKDGTHGPSQDALVDTLLAVLKSSHRTYLILDALDECTERNQMIQLLKSLINSFVNLNLLITSRPEQDIKTELQDNIDIKLSIQSDRVKDDVELYVNTLLEKDTKLKCARRIKEEVLIKLVEGAHGMYIYYLNFRSTYC